MYKLGAHMVRYKENCIVEEVKNNKEKQKQPWVSLSLLVLFSSLHIIGSKAEYVGHLLYFLTVPTFPPEEN